ncbi:cytochrome c3 family protein [Desulfurella multipotens]|nr:NapC/NirT family cytochrome c [Desulfurella multipotens]
MAYCLKDCNFEVFMQNQTRPLKAIVIAIIGIVIGVLLSFATYIGVEKTAGENFCASCHSMQPMVQSYTLDVHGGNNQFGFKAQCTDCHLPHNSLPNYLFTKAKTGLNDVFFETFTNTSKINWAQKLKDPNKYVYDSGCLKCHSNLKEESLQNQRAFLAHRAYFAKTTTQSCVDCHSNVGHKDLKAFIKS